MRGAPAIGVAAAYGMALAAANGADLDEAYDTLVRLAPDGRQPALGARRDARRPVTRARPATPRGGGRALPLDGRACGDSRPVRSQGPDALQRRRARNRRLWIRRRCDSCGRGAGRCSARVGGRDTTAAPGSAPDRIRARGARHPARRHRRRRGRIADGGGGGRRRDHRRGSHRRERRHGQQDRHLRPRRARAPSRDPVRHRGADLDDRPGGAGRVGDPDRGARRRRGDVPLPRPGTPPST